MAGTSVASGTHNPMPGDATALHAAATAARAAASSSATTLMASLPPGRSMGWSRQQSATGRPHSSNHASRSAGASISTSTRIPRSAIRRLAAAQANGTGSGKAAKRMRSMPGASTGFSARWILASAGERNPPAHNNLPAAASSAPTTCQRSASPSPAPSPARSSVLASTSRARRPASARRSIVGTNKPASASAHAASRSRAVSSGTSADKVSGAAIIKASAHAATTAG